MAWTDPIIYPTGYVITASDLATQIYSNLRYLKGMDGDITLSSGLIIDNSGGVQYLKLPSLTTAQIGTVLATSTGRVAYDSTVNRIKFYDSTAIRSVVSTADVDDTPVNGATTDPISSNWAYDFQNVVTATGDIRYATGAGVETNLPKGTALQYLRQNAALTAPEWANSPYLVASGTYGGNGADDRQIVTGFACKQVTITRGNTGAVWICLLTTRCLYLPPAGAITDSVDVLLHATNGFIVDKFYANESGADYTYVAIG